MNTPSRWFLSILAFCSVVALGYYAYLLSSQTLSLPFLGSDMQYGDRLELVVSPPSLVFGKVESPLLDPVAIEHSLLRDGKLIERETLSGEYQIETHPSYLSITRDSGEPNKSENISPTVLSADLYNKLKTTPYRLPRDITLVHTDVPRSLSIDLEDDPRKQIYNVTLYGPGEYRPEDIHYYVHYNKDADCSLRSWGDPQPYDPPGYSFPMKG